MLKKQINLVIVILSLGKLFSAAGQTVFNTHYFFEYINNVYITGSALHYVEIFTAICTTIVVLSTRIQPIYYSFHRKKANITPPDLQNSVFYKILLFFVFSGGIFSCFGAYLGSTVLLELIFKSIIGSGTTIIQYISIVISLSVFASFYTFNYAKAKNNIVKFLITPRELNSNTLCNINTIKVMSISWLSIISSPFLAYFLTKHALFKLLDFYSFTTPTSFIVYCSIYASVASLITSITTTLPATHSFFNIRPQKNPKFYPYYVYLKRSIFFAGIFDCLAMGAGSFLGVLVISHDLLNIAVENYSLVIIALGCGLSNAILNWFFSVRQGFYDNYMTKHVT